MDALGSSQAIGFLSQIAADTLHILLVLFLVACAAVRQVGYINLALATLVFLIVWPPAAYIVLVLATGAMLLPLDQETAVASREQRRRSLQGRRRSLQEPEWLRQAAASLLLPSTSAEPEVPTEAVPKHDVPVPEVPVHSIGADDDAPAWLLQAEATLASTTTPHVPRPKKSPPRSAPRTSPPVGSPLAEGGPGATGPSVRTRNATKTQRADSAVAPRSAIKLSSRGPTSPGRTPGSVRFADETHSPLPSRARLHKHARALNDGSSSEGDE